MSTSCARLEIARLNNPAHKITGKNCLIFIIFSFNHMLKVSSATFQVGPTSIAITTTTGTTLTGDFVFSGHPLVQGSGRPAVVVQHGRLHIPLLRVTRCRRFGRHAGSANNQVAVVAVVVTSNAGGAGRERGVVVQQGKKPYADRLRNSHVVSGRPVGHRNSACGRDGRKIGTDDLLNGLLGGGGALCLLLHVAGNV